MAIKDYFARNGYTKNVVFIIAASLYLVVVMSYLLMGPCFLHVAPVAIFVMLSGLVFRPSKLYLPFCAGLLLQYGLFSSVMGLLMFGLVLPIFFHLITGVIGYTLLLTSIWQAVLGEWKLTQRTNLTIQIISILGILLAIYAVVFTANHMPPG